MQFIFFIFSLCVTLCPTHLLAADWQSFVSQRHLHYQNKIYDIYEIRGCELDQYGYPSNVRVIRDGGWGQYEYASNEQLQFFNEKANILRKAARRMVVQEYERRKIINDGNREKVLTDVDSMYSEQRSIILVTEPADPLSDIAPKILLMVSFHQDGPDGLPLEKTLKIKLPRNKSITMQSFPDYNWNSIGPNTDQYAPTQSNNGLRVENRSWRTRGIGEIKTFVGDPNNKINFLPLIMKLLVRNARWAYGQKPIFSNGPSQNEILKVYTEHHGNLNTLMRFVAPHVVPVTRIEKLWIEAPTLAHRRMYQDVMKFEDPLPEHRMMDPSDPRNELSTMSIDPIKFENEAYQSVLDRSSGAIINDGYLSNAFDLGKGRSLVFFEPDHLAALKFLKPYELLLRSSQDVCLRSSWLVMGNGNLEKGIRAYMSQFAKD